MINKNKVLQEKQTFHSVHEEKNMVHVETQALSAADKKNKITQENLIHILNDLNLKRNRRSHLVQLTFILMQI